MQGWLKTLIAGYGAKKLGGGCFSTILVFIVIYWALGQCNRPAGGVRQGNMQTEQRTQIAKAPHAPSNVYNIAIKK